MSNQNIIGLYLLAVLMPGIIESISVVGPRVLRPHHTYRAALVAGSRRVSVLVGVEGRRSGGELFSQSRELQLQPGAVRIVDLEIGDPGPGSYELVARSTSGTQFSASSPLVYQNRSFCVFVQTDKRVYQPGDLLNFRVVALDKFLLPLEGHVDVTVLDSGGSPVRQWAGASLDRGLFTTELTLADQPALGEWTLQVSTQGQTYERRVLVAEYILPKFDIQLDLPKQVLFSDGSFTVNITARHYNGMAVRGELTLAAYPVFFSDVIQPVFSSPVRKVVRIDGQTNVTFSIKSDLNLAEDAARPVVVEAILEEEGTLRRQNVSARTLLLRTPYRLKVHAPDHFKPNLPYKIQLEVVDSSGATARDTEGEVSVQRVWDDGAPPNTTAVQLARGQAVYMYTPDTPHTNSTLNFLISYKEVVERITNVRSTYTSSSQFLGAELVSSPRVGGDIHARVTATEQIDTLHYVLIARGDVLVAKTMELAPPRRSVDLHLEATAVTAPGAVLLAWYPRLDGELVAASLYIPVDGLLQNKVQLLVSPKRGRPGGTAEVSVVAEPGSHAAVLGADARTGTAALASPVGLGDGLTLDQIEREVESFSGLSHSLFKNDVRQPMFGTEVGESNTADTFLKSGLVVLTDGFVTKTNPGDKEQPTPPGVETGTRPPLAGPYAFSYLPPPPSPRYYLPHSIHPSWFFANLTTGSDDRGSVSRRTPITSGEWRVGAFAVHPTLGLGLAEPTDISADTALSLDADLPATLQKGEAIAVIVTLTNTLSADTSVEVTFHNSEQYFEFEPIDNNIDSVKKIELYQRQRVTVPAHGVTTTAFLVSAVRTGQAPVLVQASGEGVSASLYRNVDVMNGEEQELSTWQIVDARSGVARSNLSLTAPLGTRLGPASLRVAGDLLAPALHALKTLPMAAADADQALQPLIVGCILLDYLQATRRDEGSISAEARLLIEFGNQRVLAFRRSDGSFGAELKSTEGDVWMTASAARWLSRGARHLPVAPQVAQEATRWLANSQQVDGSWTPPPTLQRLNPQAQRPLPLTALALIALLDSQGSELFYKNAISKATDYLARHLEDADDAYTLALLARALGVVRHPKREAALGLLDLHSNATASERWWTRPVQRSERRNPWMHGNSVDVSTAAWGLQALLAARQIDDAVKVARWLMTTEAVLNADKLEALSDFALESKTSNKLRISAKLAGSEESRQFSLDDDNSLIIQTQLIKSIYNVSVSTEGRGVGAVGLMAMGSTNVTSAWPRYTLDPRVDAVSTQRRLQLSICSGFVTQPNETRSGFTLLTVQLPSGFVADTDTLTALMSASHVTSAQLAAGGTRVLAWLRPLDNRERCATLVSARAVRVARQRPGWAELRDCYDSSHRARVFFSPVQSHVCNICQDLTACSNVCGSNLQLTVDEPSTGGGRNYNDKSASSVDNNCLLYNVAMLLVIAGLNLRY